MRSIPSPINRCDPEQTCRGGNAKGSGLDENGHYTLVLVRHGLNPESWRPELVCFVFLLHDLMILPQRNPSLWRLTLASCLAFDYTFPAEHICSTF